MLNVTPPPDHNNRFSSVLDLCRWLAAFLVLFSHLNSRALVGFAAMDKQAKNPLLFAWTFICGFAHQAVMVFFVMSGLLVGGGLYGAWRAQRPLQLRRYGAARLARLYAVVIPALLLTALADYVGTHYGDASIYLPGVYKNHSLSALACNAAFLQTIRCDPFGSDQPLWSLANEFWYYVLFPLLLVCLSNQGFSWRARAVAAIVLVGLVLFFIRQPSDTPILTYFPIWLLGVWVASAVRPVIASERLAWGLFLLWFIGTRLLFRNEIWRDPRWGWILDTSVSIFFAVALLATRLGNQPAPIWGSSFSRWFADRSFSLYAVHVPLLMAFFALWQEKFHFGFREEPSLRSIGLMFLAFCIVLSLCIFFYQTFESRHLMLRSYVLGLADKAQKALVWLGGWVIKDRV